MKKTQALRFTDLPTDYAGLCRRHLPRPIHDGVEYANTVEITDVLAGHDLTADQEDYFDLLCRLIEEYDRAHWHPLARSRAWPCYGICWTNTR